MSLLAPSEHQQVPGPHNGHAIQVVVADQVDGRPCFDLNIEALEEVLLNDRVRDKKVVVVSVAGAFRKGKSFLLDFLLRYLSAGGSQDWLGLPSSPLGGFHWRGGAERDTTGILLWSEPFLFSQPNGEQVAVLLMDTQGAFDSQSTVKECATVFALSTMLSSIQVYNISSNFQEDYLHHLGTFTEYGRLALEDSSSTPFQHLEFLIRDWSYPYDYPYGSVGGEQILEDRLKVLDNQQPEVQQIRRHIKSCFRRIGCFLMPHPGLKVSTNPQFDGRLEDIEPEFVMHLRKLVPRLAASENLVVKEINGNQITCRELVEYFKVYVNIYKGDELPEPKTMLQATAEANNHAALATSRALYVNQMDDMCGGTRPYVSPDLLDSHHAESRETAISCFTNTKKMGGKEFSEKFLDQLETEISKLHEQYRANNKAKNLLTGVRTPMVLLGIGLVFYVVSGFFEMISLTSMATLAAWPLWMSLLLLAAWMYVTYSGTFREVGVFIDSFVDILVTSVLNPLFALLVEQTSSRMTMSQQFMATAFNKTGDLAASMGAGSSTKNAAGVAGTSDSRGKQRHTGRDHGKRD